MAALDAYLLEAERFGATRPASEPGWLPRARREALDRFANLGFPTTRDEEWRFTSVAPIAEGRFALARDGATALNPRDLAEFELHDDVAAMLVFVNGRYAPVLSRVDRLVAGVRVESLARAVADSSVAVDAHLTRVAVTGPRAFTALNTAFLADGAFVHVPDGAVLSRPIHLLFVSAPEEPEAMAHPRVLIVMGTGSQASIVETYAAVGADRYLTNAVTEIVARESATLTHYKIQRESPTSFHIATVALRAGRDANVASHSVSLGGSLVRNDVMAVLDGEGATCTLNGLYWSDGSRLVDNHTTIDHARPHCGSREVYKGILAGKARAVFNGKIIVRPDAQKTDAKQTNKALLLSRDAQINTKPQLEIFANDVKCTHGAAVGQMDEEAIFYLRARGLSETDARGILVQAFAGDVLNHMPLESLRTAIDAELSRRLAEWRR